MVPAVLFDFDGVIVDSLSMHMGAWQHVCDTMLHFQMDPALREKIIGSSTREIATMLVQLAPAPKQDVTEVVRQKNLWLRDHVQEIPLLPGVHEMFAALRTAQIPYGIASNASREYLMATVKRFALDVSVVYGLEDYAHPKPAPEAYLKLAKTLCIPFTRHPDVIVFEDSTHGLKAAVRAGMIPIGVLTQHSDAILRDAGAKATCRDLAEALARGFLTSAFPV